MDAAPLFFAGASIDRCSQLRADEQAVDGLRRSAQARYLLLRGGRVRAEPGTPVRVAWRRLAELEAADIDVSTTAFLGLLDGQPRFAVIPSEPPRTAHDRFASLTDDDDFVGLRRAALTMRQQEAHMAGLAVHLSNWINRNRYCGFCAAPTQLREGGHKLKCTDAACAREEFPRTDPVIITLVTHRQRCFLARQPRFPPRFYSALAGFVEPGETLETAVRREVREEAGIEVGAVAYVGSQPWPFPTSLMIGYLAQAASENFSLDQRELEDGGWFDRAEIAARCALEGEPSDGILLPPPGVMARRLIEQWLA